ncbi:MAG: spermidine synthase [Halanaerobiales bacterium]|nr:spermidine synthase [Halanaerobiales bacterium]
MEKWASEVQTKNLELRFRISEFIHAEKSEFQEIVVVDTLEFGRMLLLDGIVQTTVNDEFVYHEMITHVPLFAHPNPRKVAVIGGGDGGVVREIIKHDSVERVVLCEIDEAVVRVAKEYLPEISCALDDERVEVLFTDGIEYLKKVQNEFDVIIIDSTDPIGPAKGLFVKDFYASVYSALTGNGIFVAQTESPFVFRDILKSAYRSIAQVFPVTRLYLATVPTYPGGLWSFTAGSKTHDVIAPVNEKLADSITTKYYTAAVHKAAFALPKFVEDLIENP